MSHLGLHHRVWGLHHRVRRVARGGHHRLAGRDTTARDAIAGGVARMFRDPGEAA